MLRRRRPWYTAVAKAAAATLWATLLGEYSGGAAERLAAIYIGRRGCMAATRCTEFTVGGRIWLDGGGQARGKFAVCCEERVSPGRSHRQERSVPCL